MRSGSEPTGKVPFPICLRTQIATPDDVNQVNAGFTMEISSATLTFFLPGTAATPASPSKAWLIFPGSALPYQNQRNTNDGSNEHYQQTPPLSDFTITLPGGKPTPAVLTGQGGPDDESGDNGGWD